MMTARIMISTGGGRCPESATTLDPIATKVAVKGVMKPASRQAALARLSPITIQPTGPTFACVRYGTLSEIKVALTNPRRRRRPKPGQPLGKAENSFCRTTLLCRGETFPKLANGA